ncbi:MAG: DUF4469 domain-containing protein [Parabacteroides sp.]|nr:DUF4469 domain-containing protein [Parabacteroides sp.]
MASTDPKKKSITGKLVENKLTERPDDYSFNVTYVQNRSIGDLCKLAAARLGTKYSASEIESIYDAVKSVSEDEICSGCIVEFGLTSNSLGVEGSFIGPKAQFDPARNKVVLRSTPTAATRALLADISVIVSHVEEGLPTIVSVTDVATGIENSCLTPGGGLVGRGDRCKIAGEAGQTVGFFFVNAADQVETAVPATSLMRNEPANFSFVIPALANGTYFLEVVTQYVGGSAKFLKEPRRNRFPYPLTVGDGGGGSESPDEI